MGSAERAPTPSAERDRSVSPGRSLRLRIPLPSRHFFCQCGLITSYYNQGVTNLSELTFSESFFPSSVSKIDLESNILSWHDGDKYHVGFYLHPHCDLILCGHLRFAGNMQPVDGELAMLLLAGILAVCLLIYLFLALLWPERFG